MNVFASRILTVILAMAMISLAGCSQKKTAGDESTSSSGAMDANTMGDSDNGKAMGLQTVNFPYDSSSLDATAKGVLKANAAILSGNGGLKVQIEGHCDTRGGIQYNIALGEKRANAAKKYLEDLGVAADRVTTISYGKERPLDPGSSEEAHAKNRRGNFVITAK